MQVATLIRGMEARVAALAELTERISGSRPFRDGEIVGDGGQPP